MDATVTTETVDAIEVEDIEVEDDDHAACDHCGESVRIEALDDDGFCPACVALHFVCRECEGRTLKIEAHATHETLCGSCGEDADEAARQEVLDGLKDELQELVDGLVEQEDLDAIRKAIRAVKRLTK